MSTEFAIRTGQSYNYLSFDPGIYGTKRGPDNLDGGTLFRERRIGTPVVSSSLNSKRGSRSYLAPHQFFEQNQIDRDFLGGTGIGVTSTGKLYYARTIPHRFRNVGIGNYDLTPFADSVINCRGERSSPTGLSESRDFTEDDGIPWFGECEFTVTYSVREYIIAPDVNFIEFYNAGLTDAEGYRYMSWQRTPVAKWQTLPPLGTLYWEGTNEPAAIKSVIPLVEYDLVVTQHELPVWAINEAAIADCIGKTNALSMFGGAPPFSTRYPPGSLLMLAPAYRYYPHYTGQIYVDIAFRFRYVSYGEFEGNQGSVNAYFKWSAANTVLNTSERFLNVVTTKSELLRSYNVDAGGNPIASGDPLLPFVLGGNGVIQFANFWPCFRPADGAMTLSTINGDIWFNNPPNQPA